MGRVYNNIVVLVSVWMIVGSFIYSIIGEFSVPTRWLTIIVSLVAVGIFSRRQRGRDAAQIDYPATPLLPRGALGATIALTALAVTILATASTTESIRSPWWVLPWWWAIFPLGLSIIAIPIPPSNSRARMLIAGATVLLLSSVLAFVYPLGFGFDFHIHERAIQIIESAGLLTPVTPYYIGAYVLVVLLKTLLPFVSVGAILRWIVPILASALLPPLFVESSRKQRMYGLPILFAVVAGAWIAESTPQALALLWGLISVWLITTNGEKNWLPSTVAALATLTIHPLTGIPIVVTVILSALTGQRLRWTAGILVSALLPITFLFVIWRTGDAIGWSPPSLSTLRTVAQGDSALRDILFTVLWNRWALIAGGVILVLLSRQRNNWTRGERSAIPAGILTLLNAYVFAGFTQLPEIISYETNDYAWRIAQTALVIVAPLILERGTRLLQIVVERLTLPTSAGAFSILIVLAAMSIYARYPIDVDGYEIDKGYSVSAHDLRAVQAIAEDGKGIPFIVLANQSVSAASIKAYGFLTYYSVEAVRVPIFYYSIPTGGPLYQYYLRFVYDDPSVQTVRDAMQWVGVRRAYVVINRYWKNSALLMAAAQKNATSVQYIDNGVIGVFRYDR